MYEPSLMSQNQASMKNIRLQSSLSQLICDFLQGSMILSLRYLVSTIVVLTGFMMLAKAYVDKNICVPVERQGSKNLKPKKKRKKGSLKDSLEVLRSSPMILNLALLVISYGVSHRLFEFAWKGQLRVLYPSAQAYQVMLILPTAL